MARCGVHPINVMEMHCPNGNTNSFQRQKH